MRFVFKTKKLATLYYEGKGGKEYSESIVDAFFEVMAIIEHVGDERELYAFKSPHFETLKGKEYRKEYRSLRLNDQYRLILKIEVDENGRYCLIISITKHYR